MYGEDQQAMPCEVPKSLSGGLRKPTVTERLEQRRIHLSQELEAVNKAITALKANPGVEEVMNLVSQVGY